MSSQFYSNEHLGQSQFYFWYGQVLGDWEKNETSKPHNKDDIPGWGKRYRVAILGRDSRAVDKGVGNDELPMAEVLLPVTAGAGPGGGVQTPNISQNTFVVGFYKDGINCREPIIMGVLPNFSQATCNAYSSNDQERFNPASGYNPEDQSHYVPDYNLWLQYGGWPIKESNDGGTVNGIDVANKKQKIDGERSFYIPSPYKCSASAGSSELSGIAKILQDGINLINQINRSVLDYSSAISSIENTIKSVISTISLYITSLMKNMIQKMRGFILNQLNKAILAVIGLLPPNLKHATNTATEKIMEILNCVFNKIVDELLSLVTDLVQNLITSAVNAANSVVENFIGGSFSNILGTITEGVSSALSAASGILGGALQIAANPTSALDIVFGFVSEFICDGALACPSITGWSPWNGTNTYTPETPKNVSGIGTTAGAGIGTTSIVGFASTGIIGFGSTGFVGIGSTTILRIIGIGTTTISGIGSTSILRIVGIGSTSVIGIGTTGIIGIATEGIVKDDVPCQPTASAPILCQPPVIDLIGGGGSGFKANPIVSASGEIIAFDIVNQGFGYTSTPIARVYSNCGIGNGAVLLPVVTNGRITDIIILDGGVGYLSSPNGSVGGGGQVFATEEETVAYTPRTDSYDVFVPGELVEFEAGDLIFAPAGTEVELYDSEGNVIQAIRGLGQTTCVKIKRTGVLTIPKKKKKKITEPPYKPTNSKGQYPVVLEVKDIIITNPGFNYNDGDEIIINPNCGTEAKPTFDKFGRLVSITVTQKGVGCTEMPKIYIESKTGINARMKVLFEPIRVGDLPEDRDIVPSSANIINVVDCVGRVN